MLNKVPIFPSGPAMNTYELVCAECEETKWPTLVEKPARWVCKLCIMQTGEKKDRSKAHSDRMKALWASGKMVGRRKKPGLE